MFQDLIFNDDIDETKDFNQAYSDKIFEVVELLRDAFRSIFLILQFAYVKRTIVGSVSTTHLKDVLIF